MICPNKLTAHNKKRFQVFCISGEGREIPRLNLVWETRGVFLKGKETLYYKKRERI